jgi:hypothetical protein
MFYNDPAAENKGNFGYLRKQSFAGHGVFSSYFEEQITHFNHTGTANIGVMYVANMERDLLFGTSGT